MYEYIYIFPVSFLQYYVEDSFGLRTLNEGKRLHTYSIPNISHRQWVRNLDVIKHSIIKWLT